MKLKILVVSTRDWSNRDLIHRDIRKMMMVSGFFKDLTIKTQQRKLKPSVSKGRIQDQKGITLLSSTVAKEKQRGGS